MYSKKPEVEAMHKQIESLRKKIDYLKACLTRYTDFMNSGVPLETAFRLVLHFFAAQGQEQ